MTNVRPSNRMPKVRPACRCCGSKNVSIQAVSVGVGKCNDCGFSNLSLSVGRNGDAFGDLIGALVAVGIVAVGAALVGAFLGSLDSSPQKKVLPKYDEQNWQKYFR